MRQVASARCFGGQQLVLEHDSAELGCTMRFALYLPPGAESRDMPVLLYLSGLTCTEQNVITKAGAQRRCAEHGLILLCPDTSPRGDEVPDDEGWDLGQGAGFYLTATQAPWKKHYRMDRYLLRELLPAMSRWTSSPSVGITGHSMGGHGALVTALRNPGRFHSLSALSPILEPSRVPWGIKAFSAYLGPDRSAWADWDAEKLIAGAAEQLPILIDQGEADPFLELQLPSEHFLAAAQAAGHPVEYRLQLGYDHGYHFVATFIDDHLDWHAERLR